MQFAFVLFPTMTAMDIIGAFDPLIRLKSHRFQPDAVITAHGGPASLDRGLNRVEKFAGSEVRLKK